MFDCCSGPLIFYEIAGLGLFSSPEHRVLRVSYCDLAMAIVHHAWSGIVWSVVNFLPCVHSRGHILSPILMKLGQNVCLNEISDENENGSVRSKTGSLSQMLEKT